MLYTQIITVKRDQFSQPMRVDYLHALSRTVFSTNKYRVNVRVQMYKKNVFFFFGKNRQNYESKYLKIRSNLKLLYWVRVFKNKKKKFKFRNVFDSFQPKPGDLYNIHTCIESQIRFRR